MWYFNINMHTIYRRILLYRPLCLVAKRIKTGQIDKFNNKFALICDMTLYCTKVIWIVDTSDTIPYPSGRKEWIIVKYCTLFQTGATVFPHFSVGLWVSDGDIIRRNLDFLGLHSLDYQSSERFKGDLSRFWG